MGILGTDPDDDRIRILEAAVEAQGRKRFRRAIDLYRRVLAVEPANVELHARLAPLLATTGQRFDAWLHFRACAEAALAAKRTDQAAGLYREATRFLPRELGAWERLAAVERRRGRDREALAALLEGRKRLSGRRHRAEAIYLLRRARELAGWDPDVVLDLAGLLATTRQESEARLLLDELADRTSGAALRRVRAAQWRIAPTLTNTWHWVRALVGAGTTARRPGGLAA